MECRFVIPYTHPSVTCEEVDSVFGLKLNIAVKYVSCVCKKDRRTGRPFKRFEIETHAHERSAAYLSDYIQQNGHSEVVYREPFFWKIYNA
jgi:hypothetical protein